LADVPGELLEALKKNLRIQNPKWFENHRMGRWNRGVPKELRFYDKTGKNGLWIPRGYIRHLIGLCRRHGISYEIEDLRHFLPDTEFDFSGRLKQFQEKAAEIMLSKDFGVLCAPTGSGKTIITLFMIAMRRQPALVIVHTKELAYQWVSQANTFLGIPKTDIGFIGDGKNIVGEKLTIALVQSLYKIADDVARQTGFIVVDECHRCPSRLFTEAVTAFDTGFMLGLSATPFRRDQLSRLIFWHMGDLHHTVDKENLIEKGHLLQAEVIVRETDFKPSFDPITQYSKMLSELTTDKERNLMIASDAALEAKEGSGISLILSDRKAHCKNLRALLKYRFKISSELLTGDVHTSERQAVLARLNNGKVKILIATGQLIGEGFDCKALSTLFMATPIKFSGRVLQYIGRVLRPAHGKKQAKIFDYVDVHVKVLAVAARARQNVYKS